MKERHDFKPLLDGMNKYIRDYIIERGLVYYKQGLVEDVQIKEPWIHATVLGNYGEYEVQVHLTDFSKSRCGCPYDDHCKHMAAVVYYVTREFAGQQGFNDQTGFSSVVTSDDADTHASETLEQQPASQPNDDLQQLLQSMVKYDLLETINRLAEIEPSLWETLRLILTERERNAELHSDRVSRLDLHSSLAYHQKRFPSILKECESLFSKIETSDDDYDDYDDGYDDDYNDMAVWDFTKGLEILSCYGQELLKLVTAEHYISGTVGLLVALIDLEAWIAKYASNNGESEIVDIYSEFQDYLEEAFERIRGYQLRDLQAQTFLSKLIDWVILQCIELDDLLEWTSVLDYCILDKRYLRHLKESIIKLDKDFLQSTRLDNESHRRILVSWWVELCLSFELEEEAKQSADILAGSSQSHASISNSFVRYYEKLERWPEAIAAMQTILNTGSKISPPTYQHMVRLYERSGNIQGTKDWYEKWFLSYPDFDLFIRNADLISNDADKEIKIHRWLEHLEQKSKYVLLISIYLNHLIDIDKAWSVLVKHKAWIQVGEPLILKLFKTMKKHSPAKLIPVCRELAIENINNKNRSAYVRAVRWMKELKEVCGLSGNEEIWTAFYCKIMTEHRRLRALMEEIRSARLG